MAGVTVSGSRPDDFICFEPRPDVSAISFEVTACLQGRTVTNTTLTLLDTEAFVAALRAFERTRSGAATLEGTYDFRLTVRPHGRTGAAWLGFHVAEYIFLEDSTHGRLVLEGGFVVPGEFVGRLTRDFARLLGSEETGRHPRN